MGTRSLAQMTAKVAKFAEPDSGGPLDHRRPLGPHALARQSSSHPPGSGQSERRASGISRTRRRPHRHRQLGRAGAARITGKTAPPQGGAIDLDAAGEPTGILRESATDLVRKVIPPPSHDELRRGAELAIDRCALPRSNQRAGFQRLEILPRLGGDGNGKESSICASRNGCRSTRPSTN